MTNETPDRTSSKKANQQVTLRIPTATPTVTALLVLTLLLLWVANMAQGENMLLRQAGLGEASVLEALQLHRLLTSLVLLPAPTERMALTIAMGLLSLYTLYIVGNSMERLWGNLRFALVYLLVGLLGVVLTLLLMVLGLLPGDGFYAAAPGAVLGLLGAEWMYMRRHRKLYGQRGQQRQLYLAGLAALNIMLMVFAPFVDVVGSLASLAGGVVLAWQAGPLHLPTQHPDEPGALLGEDVNPLRTRWLTLLIFATLILAFLTAALYLV